MRMMVMWRMRMGLIRVTMMMLMMALTSAATTHPLPFLLFTIPVLVLELKLGK